MATTMRKETLDKQYAQYQQAYLKNDERGNIRSIEGSNGFDRKSPMMSRETFEDVAKDYLSDMSSKDSYRKSILGRTIFNNIDAKYRKEREDFYRREMGAQLEFIKQKDSQAYAELFNLLKGHTYKSGGKTHIKADFFAANMFQFVDLFWAAGGGYLGDS